MNVPPVLLSLFPFLVCVPEYILEPPPCRSDPENCTQFCTLQKDCQKGLQCCSAFCGTVCTSNKDVNHKR
ncbi:WAP four-disulfide core domain protein 13 [Manis javanica]|nr:WAP four-disulfide core domain protein 13 [Manis javanica]